MTGDNSKKYELNLEVAIVARVAIDRATVHQYQDEILLEP
jgi:hypothetical protein